MFTALFAHPNSVYHDISASGSRVGSQGFQAAIYHQTSIADGEQGVKKPESHFRTKRLCSTAFSDFEFENFT